MRSLGSLRAVDPGFDAHHLLTASIGIPEPKYATPEQRNQFFDRVRERVSALPGVEAAALSSPRTVPDEGGQSATGKISEVGFRTNGHTMTLRARSGARHGHSCPCHQCGAEYEVVCVKNPDDPTKPLIWPRPIGEADQG